MRSCVVFHSLSDVGLIRGFVVYEKVNLILSDLDLYFTSYIIPLFEEA